MKMIGKVVLGLLILMTVAVLVNPMLSVPAWELAFLGLSIVFWGIVLFTGIVLLFAVAVLIVELIT